QEQQQNFIKGGERGSKKIRSLKKILDRFDLRYNIVLSAPLNVLFQWNLQQVLALEKWKKKYAADVNGWFVALGKFETICSFATISFNNSGWVFPKISAMHFLIEGDNIGHPLITKSKRVDNDVMINKPGEIMLVTGSNMAGKSTYLRSVGINVVLAMAGSAVCASAFTISTVQLLSSMRVSDNLEESTSTFYAELKKLKLIIDKVNNNEKIFILLDEILRGTNSNDRHTGSVALIKQFIKNKASVIVATHDVALAALSYTYPDNILNFHFDAQIKDEELYFDYALKPGVSTSLNASLLMKKIGIEL
ncbi:MAG: DNA mismatch repair protein MutS, partial [Ferruginibacter sp.]